jgi:hypothetical protein
MAPVSRCAPETVTTIEPGTREAVWSTQFAIQVQDTPDRLEKSQRPRRNAGIRFITPRAKLTTEFCLITSVLPLQLERLEYLYNMPGDNSGLEGDLDESAFFGMTVDDTEIPYNGSPLDEAMAPLVEEQVRVAWQHALYHTWLMWCGGFTAQEEAYTILRVQYAKVQAAPSVPRAVDGTPGLTMRCAG